MKTRNNEERYSNIYKIITAILVILVIKFIKTDFDKI